MKSTPSPELSRYLAQKPGAGHHTSPTNYVLQGADCIQPSDLTGLVSLLPQVREKTARIKDSVRLRHRLELLAQYYEEAPARSDPAAQKETAFVLFYFLKGYDLIPDSLPEVGLLDDALLVETVFRRNLHTLESHWAARHRPWPQET
jgi:uncharacterized membrane protein YkvA (DUF1232 family)